jgi:predicted GH43/DUF377 family glycosyl hydrolase
MKRTVLILVGVAALAAACAPPPPAPVDTTPPPVLTATLPWEGRAVQEPTVMFINGTYRMWYRAAGWEDQPGCTLGYATSTDGVSWSKVDHPVLGQGAGGELGQTCFVSVDLIGSVFYAFYGSGDGNLRYATSNDGVAWQAQGVAMAPGSWDLVVANTSVWVENGTWKMVYEAFCSDGRWRMSSATGTGPSTWTKTNAIFTDFDATPSSMAGGPEVQVAPGGGYFLYFHRSAGNSNLPTDIYRSYSSDLEHWSPPALVLEHVGRGWQYDQVADPSVVGNLMWFDGDNNPQGYAAIGMARL